MKSPEEKRWERLQQRIFAESRGDDPVHFGSQRTLFGIKSHTEEVIERAAAEENDRCKRKIDEESSDAGSPSDASQTHE